MSSLPMVYPSTHCCRSFRWKKRWPAGSISATTSRLAGGLVNRHSNVTDIYEKAGRSGPLIFYEVMMEVRDDDGELVVSEKTTRILR